MTISPAIGCSHWRGIATHVEGLPRVDESIAGNLKVQEDQTRIVTGNLTVGGRCSVKGRLIVLGDLHIDKHHEDSFMEIATIVVGEICAADEAW